MATYYVRLSGSDSNNGTSAATAWRTLGKALSGITSGNFTAGTSTTLTTSGLTASAWIGATVTILTGTGAGSTGVITANTTTQITVASWSGTAPSGSGTYQVTHLASGDQLWIGAGTYRETVTISTVTPISEIKISGDVTGAYTGDGGEIIWSAYTLGDFAPPTTTVLCNINNKSYFTFDGITFIGADASSSGAITSSAIAGTNITIRNCTFFSARTAQSSGHLIGITATGFTLNWVIENCRFLTGVAYCISIVCTTLSNGADYDINVTVRNCVFIMAYNAGAVGVNPSGALTYKGNGAKVINCSGFGQALLSCNMNLSTTYPSTVQNCTWIFTQNNWLYAQASGMISDLGGNRVHPYTSSVTPAGVTTHATTKIGSFPNIFPIEIGQSALNGVINRSFFTPYATSGSFSGSLGFGNVAGGASTDILNNPRPSGASVLFDSGTASSGTASTLVDSSKNWPTSTLIGWLVRILSGQGAGQIKRISGNSSNTLTISGAAPAGGQWATIPNNTSSYVIYQGSQVETGKATSGTTSTLVDSNANWATGQWSGYICDFDGQLATVASNTATTLTFSAAVTNAPTLSSTYSLYFPGASLTAALPAAGAFEGGNTGKVDTSTYLS